MTRADYLKTSKVRHNGAEEASLMFGLGPQVAFALLCFNRATPTFAFFCINPISEYCNSEPQPISLLPWYTLYCFVVDYRWCTRVILN